MQKSNFTSKIKKIYYQLSYGNKIRLLYKITANVSIPISIYWFKKIFLEKYSNADIIEIEKWLWKYINMDSRDDCRYGFSHAVCWGQHWAALSVQCLKYLTRAERLSLINNYDTQGHFKEYIQSIDKTIENYKEHISTNKKKELIEYAKGLLKQNSKSNDDEFIAQYRQYYQVLNNLRINIDDLESQRCNALEQVNQICLEYSERIQDKNYIYNNRKD